MDYSIDPMMPTDWEPVRAIYLEGIATRNATFECEPPSWEKWNTSHLPFGRLVARGNDVVLGWGALSPVSSRCCYAGVAEASIYVGNKHRGQGIGGALLRAMIDLSEKNGIWTLQAGIFPENKGSLALVRKCGFREIGRRERLGQLDGVWRDVLLLERRSPVVGLRTTSLYTLCPGVAAVERAAGFRYNGSTGQRLSREVAKEVCFRMTGPCLRASKVSTAMP